MLINITKSIQNTEYTIEQMNGVIDNIEQLQIDNNY